MVDGKDTERNNAEGEKRGNEMEVSREETQGRKRKKKSVKEVK